MIETAVKTRRPLLREVVAMCSRLNIPAQAVLELTYRCNLHCVHCYVDRIDETDELTTVEWKDVIDQLKAAGTMYLLFTGGEIMLRPDLLDIASYARRQRVHAGFPDQRYDADPGHLPSYSRIKTVFLGLSLYGATAATHESSDRCTLALLKKQSPV